MKKDRSRKQRPPSPPLPAELELAFVVTEPRRGKPRTDPGQAWIERIRTIAARGELAIFSSEELDDLVACD